MIDTSEKNFETKIAQSLLNNGYQKRDSKDFDKTRCLIPQNVVNFIQSTQTQEWDKFKSHYGEDAATKLFQRLSNQMKTRGTLAVLREGIKVNGCKFHLAYFKSASGLNPDTEKLYQKNIFSLI